MAKTKHSRQQKIDHRPISKTDPGNPHVGLYLPEIPRYLGNSRGEAKDPIRRVANSINYATQMDRAPDTANWGLTTVFGKESVRPSEISRIVKSFDSAGNRIRNLAEIAEI